MNKLHVNILEDLQKRMLLVMNKDVRNFFKLWDLDPDRSEIQKKFRTRFLTLETPEAIYNFAPPGDDIPNK